MSDTRRILKETFATNLSDYTVAIAAVAIVMMIIIPLPTVLLDVLMSLNLALSLLILLLVLSVRRAVDFSVFPTMLLVIDHLRTGAEHIVNEADSDKGRRNSTAVSSVRSAPSSSAPAERTALS